MVKHLNSDEVDNEIDDTKQSIPLNPDIADYLIVFTMTAFV